MKDSLSSSVSPSKLEQYQDFLAVDPDNLRLIEDAANAAFDESALDVATDLIARYASLAELPASLLNLRALVALRQQRFDDAAACFEQLRVHGTDDAGVRFNLAWVRALQGHHLASLELLGEDVLAVSPQAPALKVQMLHHLGRLEDALAVGAALVEHYPGNDALLGALSVVAMDAGDMALTEHYALQAKGGADALTTQGLLLLDAAQPKDAIKHFDAALKERAAEPRAWIGKGLGLLATGQAAEAAHCLEKGAGLFGSHLGSWIAAGWGHFIAGDLVAARRDFAQSCALDDNFAEGHGGLAVVDLAEGDIENAKRRTEIALRLNRNCFGGMLARTMLLEAGGHAERAAKIREHAMSLPLGPQGKTLAQMLVGLGSRNGATR